MQSCKHSCAEDNSLWKVNSLLRLLVPKEVVQHLLRNPPFVKDATQQSNTYSLVPKGRMNMLWLVGWGRHIVAYLGFPHAVRRPERELWLLKWCTAVLTCKQFPAVQYTKLIVSVFRFERREKRRSKNVAIFHWLLTTWCTILYGI